jgi:uncharacterized protein YdaU (DUF1376 family)
VRQVRADVRSDEELGNMDEKIVDEILNDLYSSLEDAETQSTAVLLFLKDQGIATDEKLAPYLEQAGRASDVRWRAARVRMASLLSSAMKTPEASTPKQTAEETAKKQKSADAAAKDGGKDTNKDKNSTTTKKAETSGTKQEPSVQTSQTEPEKKTEQASEKKSEQVSEEKPRQPSEPESSDANTAEKKTEKDAA